MNIKGQIEELIKEAEKAGLPEEDVLNAAEYLLYNEYGLALDILLTQLYENNIVIPANFYQRVEPIVLAIKLPVTEYSYIKELIK
jgi:hypothetical protein